MGKAKVMDGLEVVEEVFDMVKVIDEWQVTEEV